MNTSTIRTSLKTLGLTAFGAGLWFVSAAPVWAF